MKDQDYATEIVEDDDYILEVEVGKPDLVGAPYRSGTVHIRMPLQPKADRLWVECFNRLPAGVSFWLDMEHPKASSSRIDGHVADDHIERYVTHIRERVAATNRDYAEEIAPRLKAEAERRRADEEEQAKRAQDVRRRLESV